jgi:hypothetical protein
MSASNLSRFEELASRYLDEGLTDTDAAELVALLAEAALATRFLELTRLNSEIAGLLSAPVPDAAMVELVKADIQKGLADPNSLIELPFRTSEGPQPVTTTPSIFAPASLPKAIRRKPAWRALALAAVVLAFAGLAALFIFNRTQPAELPVVALFEGEVRLLGPNGEQPLTPRQSWLPGETLKTVGPKSIATVTFSDGSRLVLGQNCVALNHSTKEGKRVELQHGTVQAALKKQPAQRSFVFVTPEAEVIVVGTSLQLVVGAHNTRLEVTEGEVRFRRRHDGAELVVKAGDFAVVAPNVPFAARPLHPNPHHP